MIVGGDAHRRAARRLLQPHERGLRTTAGARQSSCTISSSGERSGCWRAGRSR